MKKKNIIFILIENRKLCGIFTSEELKPVWDHLLNSIIILDFLTNSRHKQIKGENVMYIHCIHEHSDSDLYLCSPLCCSEFLSHQLNCHF